MKNQYQSGYAPYITDFIALKVSVGHKPTTYKSIFNRIDKFLFENADPHIGITKEVADKWSEKRNNECDLTRYSRITFLKQFSEYLRNIGFKSHSIQLPKYPNSTFVPYIYSYEEIKAIFKACDAIQLRHRTAGITLMIMPCLLRLLYATGIRIGEALSLTNADVDIVGQCLTIRNAKNSKDRIVPFSGMMAEVCKEYIRNRNKLPVEGLDEKDNAFFVSRIGLPCNVGSINVWFHKVLDQAGIPAMGNKTTPRVHDLRHSFACHSFVKLADEGMDLYCSWPHLATYLGHTSLSMTEQYVRITEQMYPELLKGTAGLYVNILHENIQKEKS